MSCSSAAPGWCAGISRARADRGAVRGGPYGERRRAALPHWRSRALAPLRVSSSSSGASTTRSRYAAIASSWARSSPCSASTPPSAKSSSSRADGASGGLRSAHRGCGSGTRCGAATRRLAGDLGRDLPRRARMALQTSIPPVWQSSFTGQAIPEQKCASGPTVPPHASWPRRARRIQGPACSRSGAGPECSPDRVAPYCAQYTAVDFSAVGAGARAIAACRRARVAECGPRAAGRR